MLPWLMAELEYAQQVLGEDYWPYGLDRNRKALKLSPAIVTPTVWPSGWSRSRRCSRPSTLDEYKI